MKDQGITSSSTRARPRRFHSLSLSVPTTLRSNSRSPGRALRQPRQTGAEGQAARSLTTAFLSPLMSRSSVRRMMPAVPRNHQESARRGVRVSAVSTPDTRKPYAWQLPRLHPEAPCMLNLAGTQEQQEPHLLLPLQPISLFQRGSTLDKDLFCYSRSRHRSVTKPGYCGASRKPRALQFVRFVWFVVGAAEPRSD
jgi:hypothetical protein